MRSYREAMREFAAMRNLELWYARLDVARMLGHAGDRVSRAGAQPVQAADRGRAAKDHLRALSKLTARVDGRPRIVAARRASCRSRSCSRARRRAVEEGIRTLLRAYRRSLPVDAATCSRATAIAHMARKVGGVGSVGTRAWIVLLLGRDGEDPLFLQVKQAGPRSLERVRGGARTARNHGQRVVQGQRLMQVDGDIFLGWLRAEGLDGTPRDYYVRQLWDWKLGAEVEMMRPARLTVYGRLCAWTLRAPTRARATGSRSRPTSAGEAPSTAPSPTFAEAYADQNERDHAALDDAVRAGRVAAERGV